MEALEWPQPELPKEALQASCFSWLRDAIGQRTFNQFTINPTPMTPNYSFSDERDRDIFTTTSDQKQRCLLLLIAVLSIHQENRNCKWNDVFLFPLQTSQIYFRGLGCSLEQISGVLREFKGEENKGTSHCTISPIMWYQMELTKDNRTPN